MYVCAGRRRVCDGAGAVAVLHEHVSVALNELEQQLEQEQKLHLRMLPTDCDLTKEIEVWRSSGDRGMRRRPHAAMRGAVRQSTVGSLRAVDKQQRAINEWAKSSAAACRS